MPLAIEVLLTKGDPSRATAKLAGSLDTATAPQLEKELAPLLGDARLKALVLDLQALTFLSSAGIRVIMATRKQLRARGGQVVLHRPQPQVAKVFEVIQALPDVQVFGSDKELDSYLAAIQRKVVEGQAE